MSYDWLLLSVLFPTGIYYLQAGQSLVRQRENIDFIIVENNINNPSNLFLKLENLLNNRNFTFAEFLIKNGADLDTRDEHGQTLLSKAMYQKDNLDVVKFLIQNGADVNAKSNSGRTPLFIAVTHQNIDVVKLLIKHGADVNVIDSSGISPLYYPIIHGEID
ncbi:MAG: ankyrin repeat domain-containing protein, partial [Xenococcaceae cyanobacterium]